MGKGKILAVLGAAAGAVIIADKLSTGTWFWEKVTATQRLQNQNQIRMEVSRVLATAERARLAREKLQQVGGKYAQGWAGTPSKVNYGLANY